MGRVSLEALISDEYRNLNARLHARRAHYGAHGDNAAHQVRLMAEAHECASILDYGCGKGTLAQSLADLDVHEYDPAIAGKDALPAPADLVVCKDVLEHVEPEKIVAVLGHLRRLTRKVLIFSICIVPAKAKKRLADGRNAHLLLRDPAWWRAKLAKRFALKEMKSSATHVKGWAIPKS